MASVLCAMDETRNFVLISLQAKIQTTVLLTFQRHLTFIRPCITNIFPNYNQQDATFLDLFISTDALQVSGGSSAHHQELKTVNTASGIVN